MSDQPRIEEGVAYLDGTLNPDRVTDVLEELDDHKEDIREVCLADVDHSDSSGIALLLELRRRWHAEGLPLCITGMPPQMQAVAEVCGVASMLQKANQDCPTS